MMRIALILMLLCASAMAHDHSRPDLDGWFKGLHSRNGSWCCDGPGKDALHLRDADWEMKDNHYRVRIPKNGDDFQAALKGAAVDTEWADVPDDAVIDEPNKDGATLVWPSYGYLGATVRCFMPGAMT